ncbi:hypothetical protein LTR08_003627 [Meristemomyces frigidus]|nr:hypothetical protein LTR08_003627 [Meristemomyces frigidus]
MIASIQRLSPDLHTTGKALLAVPERKAHLSPQNQSLIALAVCASASELYAPGIREHAGSALRHGTSVAALVEVIELTSTLGIYACNTGVALLVQVM